MPEEKAATILAQILSAMCHAHHKNIIHHDLKLSNFVY